MRRIAIPALLNLNHPPRQLKNVAFLGVVLSAGIFVGLVFRSRGFPESNVIMVMLLGVVIISVATNRLYGVTAAILTVITFNFLFTEPRFTLVVDNRQYLVTFPVMFIVALISSELTARIRKQAQDAHRRERHNELLYRAGRELIKAHGSQEVLDTAIAHLQNLLNCNVRGYLPDEQTEDTRVVDPVGCTNCGTFTVATGERVLAVLRVSGDTNQWIAGSPERTLLDAVVAQLAIALDRERLAELEALARVEIERERLKNQLLQSISHDLRSPLTSIVGFSTILEQQDLSSAELVSTVRSICTEAQWLSRLVENLLSLSRIEYETDRRDVRFEWEILDELIADAVETVAPRLGPRSLIIENNEKPVLVRTGPSLFSQVLVNLLDNSVQHTPDDTAIRIGVNRLLTSRSGKECSVEIFVSDNGPGFSSQALQYGFDRFFTAKARPDSRRGLGLGLAICKSIVDQLGGTIALSNRSDGGACVTIRLPGRSA